MGRADTHLHTEYSGFQKLGVIKFPESVVQPDKQVDKARENGMDVVCITDHDETHGAFLAERYARQKYDDIEVVVGEEVTTADGEIIGLFLTERIPDMLSVEETVDIIREQGGLVIAPHPFSFHVPGLKERILDLDIDGFEVINGGHPDKYTNMFARLVMDRYPGIRCTPRATTGPNSLVRPLTTSGRPSSTRPRRPADRQLQYSDRSNGASMWSSAGSACSTAHSRASSGACPRTIS